MLKIRSPSQVQLLLRGVGQKHSRLTRLGRFVILLVFSCSSHPFIVRRTRGTMNQLTAALRLFHYDDAVEFFFKAKTKTTPVWVVSVLAPQTGLGLMKY